MVPDDLIAAGKFDMVTALVKEAVTFAKGAAVAGA
jgi:hypothetical protein